MDLALEILGFCIGLLYLWYEYHASWRMWIVSVIMPMISMWIYFRKGLYADFGINIYYLLIAVYGYIAWRSGKADKKEKQERPISRMPVWAWIAAPAVTALLWYVMGWILDTRTDSTVPWYDAFTTALSIVGMWLLARKYLEQWFAWIIVDAVCVWLYAYKGIYFYSTLYAIYTVIAFFGYRKWRRMMQD
ncbi:MAG: nicotinamide riboside transporter PnuC [Muribaculaceae bacterium]|nr:nicotinamide riboside transporter PnuC [Muribaculaceae bacterium]MDE6331713.1 nicotinamide riboside transporter PnuC [Muribaculaceae bacterium]